MCLTDRSVIYSELDSNTHVLRNVWFLKIIIRTPPTECHWKFLRGRGVLKAKLLEEKSIKLYWNFLGGENVQNKNSSLRGEWIFSGTTQLSLYSLQIVLSRHERQCGTYTFTSHSNDT